MSRWPWRRHAGQQRIEECVVVDTRLLQSYLDGETDPVTSRRVWAHVEECRRCGAELSTYWNIKNALSLGTGPEQAAVQRMRDFAESLLQDGRDTSEEAVPEAGI
jgi:anti-sigma factor RsiW